MNGKRYITSKPILLSYFNYTESRCYQFRSIIVSFHVLWILILNWLLKYKCRTYLCASLSRSLPIYLLKGPCIILINFSSFITHFYLKLTFNILTLIMASIETWISLRETWVAINAYGRVRPWESVKSSNNEVRAVVSMDKGAKFVYFSMKVL